MKLRSSSHTVPPSENISDSSCDRLGPNSSAFISLDRALPSFQLATIEQLQSRALLTRFEDKFILPVALLSEFLVDMALHYLRIPLSSSCEMEDYETVYFDTQDMQLYRHGQRVPSQRQKVRLRRYRQRRCCFLEVKSKDNKGTTRKVRTVHDYCDDSLTLSDREFVHQQLFVPKPELFPQATVRYKRLSCLSTVSMERITVDCSLQYLQAMGSMNLSGAVIVESKRSDRTQPSFAQSWLQEHGIFPSVFSKFKTGLWLRGEAVSDTSLDMTDWRVSAREEA